MIRDKIRISIYDCMVIFLPLDWGKVICPNNPIAILIVQGVEETEILNKRIEHVRYFLGFLLEKS
jgi:hypothetical protein